MFKPVAIFALVGLYSLKLSEVSSLPFSSIPFNEEEIEQSNWKIFNDSGFKRQWYFTREDGVTLNVLQVWKRGITGKGVVVAVVDDGLNIYHDEIRENYLANASYDFVDNDTDPLYLQKIGHGSNCAGVIAAKANNGLCGVGIAYNAKVAGIRLFTSKLAPEQLTAQALQYRHDIVDIYSNSWGPVDNGVGIQQLGKLANMALLTGATKGRQAKGSIYVFSSGNGGLFGDSCAFDGYINNIHTIAVGALTKEGIVPPFAEPCAAILTSAFGSNDVVTCGGLSNQSCTENFGRTSAAAAMASGIIALLLEANRKLTWRDVQHLIVRTSVPQSVRRPVKNWIVNKAGLSVHHKAGFGLMDANKLITYGSKWENVPKQVSCRIRKNLKMRIPQHSSISSFVRISKKCKISYVEHVEVKLSLDYTRRALLQMDVISPGKTKSRLLYPRLMDSITRRRSYKDLVIKNVHFWGENPTGKWEFLLKNTKPYYGNSGILYYITLTVYGTETDPLQKNGKLFPTRNPPAGGWCGSRLLPAENVCCRRTVFWAGKGLSCCGKRNYDSTTHACCRRNTIVWKGPGCGGKSFDPCTQMCCSGEIKWRWRGHKCCGKKTYYHKEYDCCDGKVTRRYGKCCGNREYSPWIYDCCDNNYLVRRKWCYIRRLRRWGRCISCS